MTTPVGYKVSATDAAPSTITFAVSFEKAMDLATSGAVAFPGVLPGPLAPFSPETIQLDQWSPTDIAGCALWLDPASGVTLDPSTGNVQSWTDRVSGLTLTAPSQARQPSSSTLNGQTALQFTSSSDADPNASVLSAPAFSSTNTAMAFVAMQEQGGMVGRTEAFILSDSAAPANRLGIGQSGAGGPVWQIDVTTPLQGSSANTDPHVLAADYQNGNLYVDAAADAGPAAIGSAVWSGLVVGCAGDATTFGFNGLVGDVIIYDNPLSASDRLLVESYLSSRYGVPLP